MCIHLYLDGDSLFPSLRISGKPSYFAGSSPFVELTLKGALCA